MKLVIIYFFIFSTFLSAQWFPDNSFPPLADYNKYQELIQVTPETLTLINYYSPPPPPYIENNIIYNKNVNDTIWSIIYNGSQLGNIFFVNAYIVYSGVFKFYKSEDGGMSWNQIYDFRTDYPNGGIADLYFTDEQNGYVAGTTGGISPNILGFFGRTFDGGLTWNFQEISATEMCRNVVRVNDSTLFLTGFYNGFEKIFKSTNNGFSWAVKNGNIFNGILKLYFMDEENGWAVGTQGKIAKTNDGGESWQDVSSGSFDDYRDCIFFSHNIGWVAGTKNGSGSRPLIRTSDGGATWQNSLDVPDILHVLFTNPDTGYVITKYQIYKTTNGGGFPTESNSERRNLKSFNLSQNYPNPFNPVSTIEYEIPARGYVTLKIYDILGNEVATLVNEEKPAGNYTVKFDGGKLVSGIYLYQLRAGDFTATKKLILLK